MLKRNSHVVSLWNLWLVLTVLEPSRTEAELLVIRPGGISKTFPAVFRIDDRTGQCNSSFSTQTENFAGITIGPDQNIYITGNTLGDGTVFRFSPEGAFLGAFAEMNRAAPIGLRFGLDKHLYVLSQLSQDGSYAGQVLRFDGASGAFLDTMVSAASGGFDKGVDLLFGPDQDLYVADFDRGILRFDGKTGASKGTFVPAGRGGLNSVAAAVFGPDGHLYVSNRDTKSILKFDGSTGAFLVTFIGPGSGGLDYASGLQFGPEGKLYVSSFNTHSILRYDGMTGAFIDTFVSSTENGIRFPKNLCFTASIPKLEIVGMGRHVEIRWPAASTSCTLEITTQISGSCTWIPLNSSPSVTGGHYIVTDNLSTGSRFYRLAKP